ncbi:5-formyltetrahydrofolate cyclo-ligase [Kaarinaea lacus]
MNSRQELRKRIRRQRRALSAHERDCYSKRFAKRFAASALFRNSKHIALYLANDGELDLYPLMQLAWRMKKRCYLPILSPPFQRHLYFAQYAEGGHLIPNQFGIPEPDVGPRLWLTGRRLDLVLTPLVAFDDKGNRLGMGGGYYDRTFAYHIRHNHWCRPKLVGVAYEFQKVESLDSAAWDVPLFAVVTPDREYR